MPQPRMDFSIELDTARRTLDAPRIHGFALALKQSVAEWNSLGGARLGTVRQRHSRNVH